MLRTSVDPIPTSSNAITKNLRQIAEPLSLKKVSAALCAISVSPRRHRLVKKTTNDPWVS